MAFGDSESNQQNSQQNEGDRGNLDPYFVANSDNPTSSLVAMVFNGVNFTRWSRNVKRALIAKNKEGFINGDILKPVENHKDFSKWKRADFMVVSWILSSMNNDLADDFGYIYNAVDLWKELNERFGQSNGPLIYQLKKEIDNLNQENMTIVTYYGKLKKLWDEMQSLRAFPACVAEFEEEDKMMKFLLGLNGGFEGTVTNVLSMDPLPSINKVFSITQQIEKQKEVSSALAESNAMNSSAMAAQIHNSGQFQISTNGQGRKDWKDLKKEKMYKVCTHCKNKGHTIDQCFKLIGYPDWYNSIKASKGLQSTGDRLAAHVHSADVGDNPLDDTIADCGTVNNEMLNAICLEVMKTMKGKHAQNGETSGGNSCSFANYACIMSHSFNCTVSSLHDKCLWIVDSGACDHMTYDETLLINKRKLQSLIKVGLPDGTQMTVDTIGDIILSDKLILNDVLLVHGFKHNLLSVGRLIEHNGVHVVFTGTGYSFQDPVSFKVIGAGQRLQGLYYFVQDTDCNSSIGRNNIGIVRRELHCNTVANVISHDVSNVPRLRLPNKTATSIGQSKIDTQGQLDLLHARLGHPSLTKMKHMSAEHSTQISISCK
ncbi:uncharacterized protein [Spinacia oleracea]|uniref:Retrotransposon Copia-like N-terminal domain-containing protein n=1 Tax=Spinacia oleracea TaxID=3562 RepID=A0ABM3QPK8_SPIOL|nr:uncharacterized protein LOC130461294 [Spinacia oleracea]